MGMMVAWPRGARGTLSESRIDRSRSRCGNALPYAAPRRHTAIFTPANVPLPP